MVDRIEQYALYCTVLRTLTTFDKLNFAQLKFSLLMLFLSGDQLTEGNKDIVRSPSWHILSSCTAFYLKKLYHQQYNNILVL